jgi:hypothetical protein
MCRCRAVATCTEVVEQRSKLGRVGFRYGYSCSVCRASFSVFSDLNIAFVVFACAVATAAGALVVVYPPGSAVGAESSNRVFGYAILALSVFGWGFFASRVRTRLRHPFPASINRT